MPFEEYVPTTPLTPPLIPVGVKTEQVAVMDESPAVPVLVETRLRVEPEIIPRAATFASMAVFRFPKVVGKSTSIVTGMLGLVVVESLSNSNTTP